MKLHGYYRSSSAWRVRIALGLKGLKADDAFYHLRRAEHMSPEYRALNPQCLLPSLELDDGAILTQSLAIIEYLDETHPQPALLPSGPIARARVRAFALAIAADIHPIQNLRVLNDVRGLVPGEEAATVWARHANEVGLSACEAMLPDTDAPFCFGGTPSLADICLVPQMGNARRFGTDVARFPRLLAKEAACAKLPAFAQAVPGAQPDAV